VIGRWPPVSSITASGQQAFHQRVDIVLKRGSPPVISTSGHPSLDGGDDPSTDILRPLMERVRRVATSGAGRRRSGDEHAWAPGLGRSP
jgi:hypothetical protein